ncbi:anthranilate synthase component I family protein [Synechococcus sp. M16CYN]|uniref:anthranilate synthase component I family protein n=1 Tax=Synechococcus sp. M16CYN TaxID=3103139 RepID=UPI00324F9481
MNSFQRLVIPWRAPSIVAQQLIHLYGEQGLVWLDGDGSDLGRWVTLGVAPVETVRCQGRPGEQGASNPFKALRKLGYGHWTGWLSYEAAAWSEPSNPWSDDPMPSLWIARHDPILRFDLKERIFSIEGTSLSMVMSMMHALADTPTVPETKPVPIPLHAWTHHTDQAGFSNGVRRICDLIAAGDLFQANLSVCYSTTWPSDTNALELFLRIRKRCPAPFAGLVITEKYDALISSSPERFVSVDCFGRVQTRPIKGTRPRHSDPLRDADLAAELVCSDKDRAENVMIVDLLRNDLGRVCCLGSIQVPQLVGLESYASVHHLTSVVEGQLQEGLSWVDLLKACWPGGSVSGAPKLRACQRLYELEPTSRGPYCGSLVRIDWDGRFDSNILIRSLIRTGQTLRAHAGCGIVADSDPDGEAEELSWKLQPLLETLACQ